MPDILPVCLQDILYSRKSELREQIRFSGFKRINRNCSHNNVFQQFHSVNLRDKRALIGTFICAIRL